MPNGPAIKRETKKRAAELIIICQKQIKNKKCFSRNRIKQTFRFVILKGKNKNNLKLC